jgi:hypothetical protein
MVKKMIRAYLDSEKIKGVPGFKEKMLVDGENNSYNVYSIADLDVSYRNGQWYTDLNEEIEKVPQEIADIIEKFSLLDAFTNDIKRERGIYFHKTAKAELEDLDKTRMRLSATGKEVSDLREIAKLIKVGTIRPEESFEGPQNGMSRKDLETEVKKLEEALVKSENAHDATKKLFEAKEKKLKDDAREQYWVAVNAVRRIKKDVVDYCFGTIGKSSFFIKRDTVGDKLNKMIERIDAELIMVEKSN